MSEREIDARRNWKAQVFPYDYFTVEPGKECQYCLTDKQAELLLGLIEPLSWKTRWWTEGEEEINRDVIDQFRNDLARRLMMSCCGDELPIQYRYTEDGTLERSTDGGTTWDDAPGYDPRVYSTEFPPMEGDDGSDKQCLAATGAVAIIKQQLGDQLTDDMTRYTLGQLINDWVGTLITTANPLTALLTLAANQIFALVIATLRPALTDEVYHQLVCILDCTADADASVNLSQWTSIRSQITNDIGGIAGIFLEHLIYILGTTGTTNLLRSGGATEGDCSDCPCNDHLRIYVSPGGGTEDEWDGEYLYATPVHDGDHYTLFVQVTEPPTELNQSQCGYFTVELLTGTISISNSAMRLCDTGSLVPIGIANLPDTCCTQIAIRNFEDVPFTVRIKAFECP